jgi:hypothetical protein
MSVTDYIMGFVGAKSLSEGTPAPLRLCKLGGLVSTNLCGKYAEATARGMRNVASNVVAGVDHGASLSTTPPFALWNPTGSGKLLLLMRAAMGYVSGTLGAGFIAAALNTAQPSAPTTGSALTVANLNPMFSAGAGKAYTGSTITVAGSLIRPLFNMAPILATSAISPPFVSENLIDGSIVVPPGAVFVMQGVATAGTTPRVVFSLEWDEVAL